MKMISAIVRTSSLESIVKALEDIGVRGMTIMEVKGIGEQVELFRPYTIHSRIEIIVADERVDAVAKVIIDRGHTGFVGDGLVAVYPVDHVIKIRTKETLDDAL